MFVMDAATMREIDAASIAAGIPGLHLMEQAGAGAARAILAHPDWLWGTTLLLCGKGNNGGDALVVARLLHGEGHTVRALLLAREDEYEGDAATNLVRARRAGVELEVLGEDAAEELERLSAREPGRLVIDGILGTGFQPPLRGRARAIVESMGRLGRRVVALDAPSGLDASTGEVDTSCAEAELTVSFGFAKWGLYLEPGRRHCGRVEIVPLDFPSEIVFEAVDAASDTGLFVDRPLAAAWWQPRAVDVHKYSVGSVLVVGGSMGMSGAVSLACLGAMRAGAGLVEAMVPGSQRLAVDSACLEVLVHPLSETGEGSLSPDTLPQILERSRRHRAVVLGPGLGPDLQSARLAIDVAAELELPMVLDADGLNAFARLQQELRLPPGSVITPHTGELRRLLGQDPELEGTARVETLRRTAAELGVVLLHKGAPTMVAAPDGAFGVVSSGGPALASAGTGDVLSGVIGALLAAGHDPYEAACLGAWLHGRAGDRVAEVHGNAGLLARDLLDTLGPAGLELEEARR